MKSKFETIITALLLAVLGFSVIFFLRSALLVPAEELPAPTQTATEPSQSLDPAIAASMDKIEQQVASIRGL